MKYTWLIAIAVGLLIFTGSVNVADTFAPFRIQPGFTVPMVFVFDVLPESQVLHLVAVHPW